MSNFWNEKYRQQENEYYDIVKSLQNYITVLQTDISKALIKLKELRPYSSVLSQKQTHILEEIHYLLDKNLQSEKQK